MKHYTEDVTLSEPELGSYQLVFKGVHYKPTVSPIAVGVLLFGLRPRGIKFLCKTNPQVFISNAHQAAQMLHLHANRHKLSGKSRKYLALEDLHKWVSDAVALAPDEDSAELARALINENLGPYAYVD